MTHFHESWKGAPKIYLNVNTQVRFPQMKSKEQIIVGKLFFFFSIRGEFVRILLNSVYTSNSFAIFLRQNVFLNEPPLILRKDEHE